MRKIFEAIGLISLVFFSFFYTSRINTVMKENDEILKQIEEIKNQYKTEPIDASVENNTIIPGVSGSEVDVRRSYKKMKKINEFNENLLVYKKDKPKTSAHRVYDKYIISGNKSKSEVSLVFIVSDNDNVNSIINILNEYEVSATFYTDGNWFENNNQKIIDLIDDGFLIGNLGYNFDYTVNGISWMNTIVTKIGKQKQTYCYIIENDEYLKICSNNKSYTIRPSIVVKTNPLIEIKKNLQNGSIISLEVNDMTIKELPLIIEYINSKGLEIVNLEKMLDE